MTQRYRKSVTALVHSEPDFESGYGTRNKRRKLNEIQVQTVIPRHDVAYQPFTTPSPVRNAVLDVVTPHKPMYSRNLDKALKSILSESPRLARPRTEVEGIQDVIEVTPSVEEEGSS